MKKTDILKIMKTRLEKACIEQADAILDWLDELIEEPEEKKFDIIKFMERQYEKRYPDELFIEYPISPKLRLEVHRFQKATDIVDSEYKKYVEWLVQMCDKVAGRKTVPFDICSDKLYKLYQKRKDEDTETITEKKTLNKNRLLKV